MRITQVVPGGVADQAGLKEGDILLKINGKNFKFDQAMAIINRVPLGEYATYLIERDGKQFETKIKILKVFDISFLSRFLLGLGFLFVSFVVIMTKPKGKTQQRFAYYSIMTMLFFSLYSLRIDTREDPLWLIIILIGFSVIGIVFAPPQFVNFFFYFPVKKNIQHKKALIALMYTISVIFIITIILNNRFNFFRDLIRYYVLIPYLFFLIGFIVFSHSYFKRVEVLRRKQLRPILISISIGVAAFSYTIILGNAYPFAIFLNPTWFLPSLLIISVPIAFGYSIFRNRLMDIDLIIKKSLIYGIITASIAGTYLLFVLGFGSMIGIMLGQSENQLLTIFAFLIIAFAFDPFKRKVQEWIDRLFYQERYNYQKALLEFSQELPRLIHMEEILKLMINRISNTMHVEKISLSICNETEGCFCSTKNIDNKYCSFRESPDGLLSLMRKIKLPQSFVLLSEEPDSVKINEEDRDKIMNAGVVLSVPMILQDRLIGILNVGPKLSGKVYSQEDIDLLSTVAGQAAIAIENARLHKAEIENQKIQEELAIARRIQKELLPNADPSIIGLDIAGISIPASTVGGDYFDYILLEPKKLLVVVGDVSGKGMSAALYMSKIQGMVQIAAHLYKTPKEMLIEINRRIYDGIERKSFITMILALFDLEQQKVNICRAGHNKPLVRVNGKFEYVGSEGIGLGLERGPVFESNIEEITIPINENGFYFFYTDGLNEAMNNKLEEFGDERIYKIVEMNYHLNSRDLQNKITTEVDEFRGSAEQNDDLTMVIVKANGKKSGMQDIDKKSD
jgi:serine phosphatase RsbU (regulator of sigma subunit)